MPLAIDHGITGSLHDFVQVACLTAVSVAGFSLLNYGLDLLFSSTVWTVTDSFKPGCEKYTEARWHRLLNISVSLVHSTISGLCAFATFVIYPDMTEDLINIYYPGPKYLMIFSLGYFIYDTVDNLFRSRATINPYILIHHFVCIVAFAIGTVPGLYLGYGCVSLLMEISSIFLHLRVLYKMHDGDVFSRTYRVISLMNIWAFLVFRILVLVWMTRWLINNRSSINIYYWAFGASGLATMTVVNVVIFQQILVSDKFLKQNK